MEVTGAVAKVVQEVFTKTKFTNAKAMIKPRLLGSYESLDEECRTVLVLGELTEAYNKFMKTKN